MWYKMEYNYHSVTEFSDNKKSIVIMRIIQTCNLLCVKDQRLTIQPLSYR